MEEVEGGTMSGSGVKVVDMVDMTPRSTFYSRLLMADVWVCSYMVDSSVRLLQWVSKLHKGVP
jgi:hypothetical protein